MFLESGDRTECFGCEACKQACPKQALTMKEDQEGFRYPEIDEKCCVHCNLCQLACPYVVMPEKHRSNKYAFGGYCKDPITRFESTSGGAFSTVVETFCDDNYVIFGAETNGLAVFHSYITDKKDLHRFRKSKYSQSIIGNSYKEVRNFLADGKKVLFSGTPCQVAGLYSYLIALNFHATEKLLTIEVVCEGVPSPLYIRKMCESMENKYGGKIKSLDYRFTGNSLLGHGKWDFQVMKLELTRNKLPKETISLRNKSLSNRIKVLIIDRWFNPFWSIWLNHLMSRPSCYKCLFAEPGRIADITLGDLWGVHLYCPELYGNNGGASLAIGNTSRGIVVLKASEQHMYGHELSFEDALRYQSPMRKHIDSNAQREDFMTDLKSDMTFEDINCKWARKPSLKLLWQKYIWGNRQKMAFWSLAQKFRNGDKSNA